MTQILSWSKQIQAKHALFIFDSCFSGSVLKERALVVPQQIRAVTDKPVRQFISAGSAGQTVPSVSIFRPSFIRGIQGEADLDKDGYVTGTELGLFLQKRVTSYDTGQTPQFGKIKDPLYDEGDFVFALPQAHLSKMESKPALPKKPSSGSFSLADLDAHADEEESLRKAWQQKQGEMNAAVKQVRSYNLRNVSPSLKVEAWRRFLAAFIEDNPYSSEDENLRKEAHDQISKWETQQETSVEGKDATYTIQVLASRKHVNAKIMVEKLKLNGFKDAFIFKHTTGNKTLYRVRVGKILRSETKNLANNLKKLKFIDSVQITRF